jgi:hypothetical protein
MQCCTAIDAVTTLTRLYILGPEKAARCRSEVVTKAVLHSQLSNDFRQVRSLRPSNSGTTRMASVFDTSWPPAPWGYPERLSRHFRLWLANMHATSAGISRELAPELTR